MVAGFMFAMIGMAFYVIYESVYVEEIEKKKILEASLKQKEEGSSEERRTF